MHISLFGKTNSGKSSFLNMITNQECAITSPQPGTTTDVVDKTMELLPLGPVVFHDTAGFDDNTSLGNLRLEKTLKTFEKTDIGILLVRVNSWSNIEEEIIKTANNYKFPLIVVVTFCDTEEPTKEFLDQMAKHNLNEVVFVNNLDKEKRLSQLELCKASLIKVIPPEFLNSPPYLGDLVKEGDTVILLVPIDLQAPKGRLIAPQVQAIRDCLDNDVTVITVKEKNFVDALNNLKTPPSLVICDSQVVDFMIQNTPKSILCTTFSILMSRLKGDITLLAQGASAIDNLKDNDKVLIAEACSHHPTSDDIGRVKIPNLLRKYTQKQLDIQVCSGNDFPKDLSSYSLMIHCGGCMFNRKEILYRLQAAAAANVPVTNYGMCISYIKGVLKEVLKPFNLDETIKEK
jgi:[FeFe] hydrogenase H-cluster maturation GTPase HydF